MNKIQNIIKLAIFLLLLVLPIKYVFLHNRLQKFASIEKTA